MTTLEKIRAEILNFKEKCNASDYLGCGILEILDKYAEQEPTTRQSCKNCKQDPKECGNDAHYGFCQNWEYAEQEPTDEWQNGYDRAWAEAEVFYEQEPCEDAVSRQAVLDLPRILTHNEWGNVIKESVDVEGVRQLPSVTPQEPKTGHWIGDKAYPICPKCNCNIIEEYISCSDYAEMYKPMKYCPNCGCRMVEPQESEEV